MLKYRTSIWEEESFLKSPQVAIIGGGIVGINAAIALKEQDPSQDVLVIDRNTFPLGASTRNAGFACFGSVTELLDDLSYNDEEEVFRLLNKRRQGLELLRERVGDSNMDYMHTGSYEMFDKQEENIERYISKLPFLNEMIGDYTKLKDTFQVRRASRFGFKGFHEIHFYNQHEGQLHPGKMMLKLYALAQTLGVRFLMGHKVNNIKESTEGVSIESEQFTMVAQRVIICTNGFSAQFMPELKVSPARNQVIVTNEIANLDWQSCFHYDKGYVYFRNIGKRILLGGGRNIAKNNETTTDFDITKEIEAYLMEFLKEKIGVDKEQGIAYRWSGILGVGEQKSPIVKKHSERVILAVRLGGMGVALGSLVGKEAAELILK